MLLDRYEVLEQLGSGGLAEIHRVRDRAVPGRIVALKRQHAHIHGQELLEEFLALTLVQHPNLPAIYDYHDDLGDSRHGYTLEEVAGETADRAAARDGGEHIPAIAAGMFRALAHIHARGLVHGDLHPHNLIVDVEAAGGPSVKLLDLSPATPRSEGMGALPFLAPERLEGAPPSPAADLFAAGVTLHRLLSGALPFPDYPQLPADGVPVNLDALGDLCDVVLQLLQPRPEDRPTRAAAVLERVARAAGRALPLLTPEIVRGTLLNGPTQPVEDWPGALIDAVTTDLLDRGGAGVVVVTGALGSGRSRALREAKWALQARSAALVVSTGGAAGDAPAGAIRRLMTQVPAVAREAFPADVAAATRALFADSLLTDDADADPEKTRGLAVDRLARALLWLGRRRRVAVLVDDLESLDPLGLEIIRSTARYIAHRPEEAGTLALVIGALPSETAAALLEDAADSGRELSPPRFGRAATQGLIRSTFLGRAPTHRLVEGVRSISGGNPLVLCEAIESAFRHGWLEVHSEDVDLGRSAPSPLPVPTSATDALVQRLSVVSQEAWPLLGLMARSCVAVPARLIGPALGLDDAAAGRLLETLRNHAVLRLELDDAEARLTLAAPALRDAVLVRDPAIDEVLQRLAALEVTGLSLAGRVVCAEAALSAGAAESDRALSVARELVTRSMAREALALLAQLPAETPGLGRVLGDAHALIGDEDAALAAYATLPALDAAELTGIFQIRRGRYREALEALVPTIAPLRADNPARAAAVEAWVARTHMLQGEYGEALESCERARTHADAAVQARLSHTEGLVNFYRGEYGAAATALHDALEAWREAGRLIEQADVVNALGLVRLRQAELGPALDRFEETLNLAARSGDRERTLLTLMNVAVIHQERGEYGLAESRYREALTMARALGHRSGVMRVTQNLGNLYRYLGELDSAVELLRSSLEIAVGDGNRYMESYNRTLLGEVAWLRDRPEEAEVELRAALDGFTALGSAFETADCERSLAHVALVRGDLASARRHGASALDKAREAGIPRVEVLASLTLAEVERRRAGGDLAQALRYAEEAVEKLGDKPRPDLQWEALLTLHRVHRDRGDAGPARTVGVEALGLLDKLANKLPTNRRATFLDVRNRREAVRELRWLERTRGIDSATEARPVGKLARLLDVNQRLNEELDLSRLLEYIIDSAILLSGAERGFLLMADAKKPDGPEGLKVVVARNIDQENIRNKRYKVSYTIAQRVIESGEAVLTTDAMGDERYSDYLSIHHLKLRSVLCLPMIRQGKVLGALYIDNRFQTNAFSAEDLSFMEAFANQAAIALTNAQILEERENTLKALAQSQEKVQELNAQLMAQLAEKEKALQETEQMLVVQRRQLKRAHGYESLVGNSAKLRAVFHVLDRVCQSEISVLVTGESGTGKELVARAVHYNGPRKDRSFVAINCSSIPETLIESELFGHVRGAFTGASADKKGVFEVAHRGTLFLDEIGEMPVDMQAKLLRALQEGEIQKVGSARAVHVDVRIIAATNKNLREMVQTQRGFREDLYYRLAVVTIELPPLRERADDIPLLVQHFIEKNRKDALGKVTGIAPESMRLLMRYGWPGNVRELETVIKNASIFCEGETLRPPDFSNFPNIVGTEQGEAPPPSTRTIRRLSELEREAIIHALEVNGGNKKRTAELLGIDRRTLYNKLAAYGISVERRAHVLGRDQG